MLAKSHMEASPHLLSCDCVGLQTYDELLSDSFELVDTSEPNRKYSKQGRSLPSTLSAPHDHQVLGLL